MIYYQRSFGSRRLEWNLGKIIDNKIIGGGLFRRQFGN